MASRYRSTKIGRSRQPRSIGDEAEEWLRGLSNGPRSLPRRPARWTTWFEGAGPFLWPAGLLAMLGGLFWLASFYSPGELAFLTVVIPLSLAGAFVVVGYGLRYRRRRLMRTRRNELADQAVQRILWRQRRAEP